MKPNNIFQPCIVMILSFVICPLVCVHVEVDQMIELSMGWEPQDDVLSTMVKIGSSSPNENDNSNDRRNSKHNYDNNNNRNNNIGVNDRNGHKDNNSNGNGVRNANIELNVTINSKGSGNSNGNSNDSSNSVNDNGSGHSNSNGNSGRYGDVNINGAINSRGNINTNDNSKNNKYGSNNDYDNRSNNNHISKRSGNAARKHSHVKKDNVQQGKIKRRKKLDSLVKTNSRVLENSHEKRRGVSRWRIVEELRGDEIAFKLKSRRTNGAKTGQQRIVSYVPEEYLGHLKLKKSLAKRRHRREEIPNENSMKTIGDCVYEGKSVRMKEDGTRAKSEREKEIEEEESIDKRDVEGKQGGTTSHAGGNHVIVMVEKGSEARMACHECKENPKGRGTRSRSQDSKRSTSEVDGSVSLLWYRLTRVKGNGHFKIQEVSLDMHDDKSRDRVYVTRDHALIFTSTKTHDGGSYFCKSPDEDSDVSAKKILSGEDMTYLLKNPKVRYFYHLDVLSPDQEDAVLVSPPGSDDGSHPIPRPPVNVTDMNVRVFTDWQEWSPCSICDEPGTRRRVGQCLLTRLDHNKSSSPVFLDALLTAYGGGVPCRSSLLHGHEKLEKHVSRPDEVIQEDCNVTCRVHHAQLVMSAFGFLGDSGNAGRRPLKQKKFRESEGGHVTLKCQQTSVDKSVAWINGSHVLIPTYLKTSSKGRVWVDEHNSLHIKPVMPWDASSYVCLIQGQVKGFVKLKVKANPPECKVCLYAKYLALTYPVNFVIYIVIVYVRHKERKRMLNYDLLPQGSSSSSSNSSSNES